MVIVGTVVVDVVGIVEVVVSEVVGTVDVDVVSVVVVSEVVGTVDVEVVSVRGRGGGRRHRRRGRGRRAFLAVRDDQVAPGGPVVADVDVRPRRTVRHSGAGGVEVPGAKARCTLLLAGVGEHPVDVEVGEGAVVSAGEDPVESAACARQVFTAVALPGGRCGGRRGRSLRVREGADAVWAEAIMAEPASRTMTPPAAVDNRASADMCECSWRIGCEGTSRPADAVLGVARRPDMPIFMNLTFPQTSPIMHTNLLRSNSNTDAETVVTARGYATTTHR